MDIRYKIIACVLSITLVFSSAFSRPVYANPVVIGAAGLALTLMAAAGVTFVGMSAADIDAAVDDFLTSNPVSKTFLEQLVKEAPVVSGSLQITGALMDKYGDDILSFFQSVFDWFSDGGGGTVVDAGGFDYLLTTYTFEDTFLDMPTEHDFVNDPFAPFCLNTNTEVYSFYFFVKDGLFYDFCRLTFLTDVVGAERVFVGDPSLVVMQDNITVKGVPYFVFSGPWTLECYDESGKIAVRKVGFGSQRVCFTPDFNFTVVDISYSSEVAYTINANFLNDNIEYMVSQLPDNIAFEDGGVIAGGGALEYPERVTADDVITGWNDTISDNRDVILYPLAGEDMVGVSGFDTAYGADGVAGGAVVGVEVPVGAVDVPAGDVTGWLDKIYTKVSALPAAIGAAVIGTGSLNFDKFDNISLVSVFPFCIPFDFVNCIRYFNVSEAVPVWTIDLSGSPLAAFGTFTIDFSRFAAWAKIVKFFLYSFFVVGLVKITRLLIKG